MTPRTRYTLLEDANARVFSAVNNLTALARKNPDDYDKINALAIDEASYKETTSDAWYELSEQLSTPEARAAAFKVAQAVLVRNGYHDGLPFCPLCGKLGNPEHNGAPLIDAQVCEACNMKKVIPARIRAAQKEAKW